MFVGFIEHRIACGGGNSGREWKGDDFDSRNRLLEYSDIYVVIIVIVGRWMVFIYGMLGCSVNWALPRWIVIWIPLLFQVVSTGILGIGDCITDMCRYSGLFLTVHELLVLIYWNRRLLHITIELGPSSRLIWSHLLFRYESTGRLGAGDCITNVCRYSAFFLTVHAVLVSFTLWCWFLSFFYNVIFRQ